MILRSAHIVTDVSVGVQSVGAAYQMLHRVPEESQSCGMKITDSTGKSLALLLGFQDLVSVWRSASRPNLLAEFYPMSEVTQIVSG
jgi:hypothetical protein